MQTPDQLTKVMSEDYLLYLKKEKQCALTTVGSAIMEINCPITDPFTPKTATNNLLRYYS